MADGAAGQQRSTQPDPAADHRGNPPRVPGGGCGHPRDQHLQRQRGLAGRLRHGRSGLRAQLRRRRAGAGGRRRVQHARETALCCRRRRADDPDRVDLTGRQRSGCTQCLLRPVGRRVPRSRQRPGRRRLRPAHRRDDLRLVECQGRGVRHRDPVRAAWTPLAGDHLRHHHRCLRTHPLRSGHRGILERYPARQTAGDRSELRAGRARDAALYRRDGAYRRHLRVLLSQRRPAQRLR